MAHDSVKTRIETGVSTYPFRIRRNGSGNGSDHVKIFYRKLLFSTNRKVNLRL